MEKGGDPFTYAGMPVLFFEGSFLIIITAFWQFKPLFYTFAKLEATVDGIHFDFDGRVVGMRCGLGIIQYLPRWLLDTPVFNPCIERPYGWISQHAYGVSYRTTLVINL